MARKASERTWKCSERMASWRLSPTSFRRLTVTLRGARGDAPLADVPVREPVRADFDDAVDLHRFLDTVVRSAKPPHTSVMGNETAIHVAPRPGIGHPERARMTNRRGGMTPRS